MENNYFQTNKNWWKGWRWFAFFSPSKLDGVILHRKQIDSHICLCIQCIVISNVLFRVKPMEKIWPHTGTWKRRRIFTVFFRMIMDILLWYFTKTWQVVVSLRMIATWELTVSYPVQLKLICLSLWMSMWGKVK